jgi:hypothetical protein
LINKIKAPFYIHGSIELAGLILESTSPGIQSEEDRIERQQVDAARAKVLEIAGLEIFVNDWVLYHNLVMLLLNDEDLDSFYYSEFAF